MGTSYETILVAAGFAAVVEAVTAGGLPAVVIPIVEDRVAVLPHTDRYGVAEVRPIAVAVSERLRCPVLTSMVFDSDVITCWVYHDGRPTHRYVSDLAMIIEPFEDDDGVFRSQLDGRVIPDGEPLPSGPLGADPTAFTPFAVGAPDLDRIVAALLGSRDRDGHVWAEWQHQAIIESLGLPPAALAEGYGGFSPRQFPDAVDVPAR
ncbi:hypothetical protein ACFPIJ_61110 [Dactylosporangium cerinum]|uniref:Uncharacterized protein n=1 Tax=Dactylosporangium cerinum TaxID=1434730 RepID=A0ABV9WM77_9ACTN